MEQQLQTTVKVESSGRRIISRVLSIAIFSMVISYLIYQSDVSNNALGKAAYLASESDYYDKFLTHPQTSMIVVGFVILCIIFGVYELLAFVIYHVIPHE